MLSVTAQNNLLVLLQTEKYKIPSHIMRSFLGTIANYFRADPWSTFLLQQLRIPETSLIAEDLDTDASVVSKSAVFTGLSDNMVEQAQAMGNKFEANALRKKEKSWMPDVIENITLKKIPSFTTGTAPDTLVFESVIQKTTGTYTCANNHRKVIVVPTPKLV